MIKKRIIYFFIIGAVLLSSCVGIQKKRYRKGYHIEFYGRQKSNVKKSEEKEEVIRSSFCLSDSICIAQNTEIQIRDKNPQFFHNNDHTIFKPKKENYFPAKKGKLKRIALKSYKKQIELKSEVNETDSEELDEDYQKWLMKILLTGVLIFMLVGGFYGYLVFAAFNSVPLWGSFIVVSLLFIGTALGFAFLWKGKPKGINGFWKYFAAWLTVFTLILVLSILYLALTFSVGGGFLWG